MLLTPVPVSKNVPRARPLRARRLAWLTAVGAVLGALGAAAWLLVHSTSWAGPLAADTLRWLVGPEAVARLEDFVYGVEDRVNLATRSDEVPVARWEVPPEAQTPSKAPSTFQPANVGPVDAAHAAPGDGVWVVAREDDLGGAPLIYKTLLHPDPKRPWAEVFVTATDLSRTELELVAGTAEPRATDPETRQWARQQGSIPVEARGRVVAAFNGGFKAEHGHLGMKVGTRQLLPPRELACTVLRETSGHLTIGPWTKVEATAAQAAWWRQTPPCLVEAGELHRGLTDDATTWGATLEKSTVIRRSALGLSQDGKTLFVAVSNSTTAPAIALAMRHAGAVTVAQLDVNWSHTRFVVFDASAEGTRVARGLFAGFVSEPGMYTDKPYARDFFYLTRRPVASARR